MSDHRIHLRLTPAEAVALDQLADEQHTSRTRVIREAVAMRLNLQSQVLAIREAAAEAVEQIRLEVARGVKQMATASAAADATSRQLINTFIEALGDGAPVNPPGPATLPRRPD